SQARAEVAQGRGCKRPWHHPRRGSDGLLNLSWRERGACRGLDPAIFYPGCEAAAVEAKAVCATCPVREPCLEWALSNREHDGVWGGATERERRRMIRQRRKSA